MIVQGIGKKNKETRPHKNFFFSSFMYYSCVKNWRDGLPCHTLCLIFTNRLKVEVGNGPSFRCFRPYHCFNLLTHRSLPLCLYPAFDPMLSLLLMAGYRPVSIFNFHPPAGEYLVNKTNINDSNNDSGVNMQWCPYTIAQYNFFPNSFHYCSYKRRSEDLM